MRYGALGACAIFLTGCVGTGVEMGGVDAPVERPAETVACSDLEAARFTKKPEPAFPDNLIMFMIMAQKRASYDALTFAYDVAPDGGMANIRFTGDESYLRHGTYQNVIKHTAEAIALWRYDWPEGASPRFAAGCEMQFTYAANADARYSPGDDKDAYADEAAKAAGQNR